MCIRDRSYAKGDGPVESRQRDYTPTPNGPKSSKPGAVHGEAARYQAYLRDKVMPFMEGRFRTDPARRLFLGHSYGALLGAQMLFTDPRLFSGSILGIPSVWFGKRHALAHESAYEAKHRDMPANVYMYIVAYEALR